MISIKSTLSKWYQAPENLFSAFSLPKYIYWSLGSLDMFKDFYKLESTVDSNVAI